MPAKTELLAKVKEDLDRAALAMATGDDNGQRGEKAQVAYLNSIAHSLMVIARLMIDVVANDE